MKLTVDQQAVLMAHADAAVRRRCHTIMLFDDGFSVRRIATLTSSEPDEVIDSLRRFRTGGVHALAAGEW